MSYMIIFCHNMLYIFSSHTHFNTGNVDAAMKTALHLREYEDLLDSEDVYCILALTSCANRSFGVCSRAFIKLESLDKVSIVINKQFDINTNFFF